jgi:mannose-6-phosphate isomerase class I
LTLQLWIATKSTKKLSQNAICHSERKKPLALSVVEGEESLISASQTLRFAQGDNFEIVSK